MRGKGIWQAQMGRPAVSPPGEAREDWAILRAFAGVMKINVGFDSLDELRELLFRAVPHFADRDMISSAKWTKFGSRAKVKPVKLTTAIDNFYMTCAISRASETMAECVRATDTGQAEAAE